MGLSPGFMSAGRSRHRAFDSIRFSVDTIDCRRREFPDPIKPRPRRLDLVHRCKAALTSSRPCPPPFPSPDPLVSPPLRPRIFPVFASTCTSVMSLGVRVLKYRTTRPVCRAPFPIRWIGFLPFGTLASAVLLRGRPESLSLQLANWGLRFLATLPGEKSSNRKARSPRQQQFELFS